MDEINHWWKSIKYLTKLEGDDANSCRMYFVQRCKQLSNNIELPKQNFGPTVMCLHCGSLWSSNDSQIRITPGKAHSKSTKKIIKSYSECGKISRFRASLMRKSIKQLTNKIVIKCSVCSKTTVVECHKPKRLKLERKVNQEAEESVSQKKKKKKRRDKTAGLNISNILTPDVNNKREIVATPPATPAHIKVDKGKNNQSQSAKKMKRLDLNKLNGALSLNSSQKPRSSLKNFLKDLY